MTVYWIIWISTILFGIAIQKNDYETESLLKTKQTRHTQMAKYIFLLCSVCLIMVAGCRYYVGTDFGAYYHYDRMLQFWENLRKLDEPGIRLLYVLATHIHESGQFCIFFTATITIGIQLYTIYNNTDNLGVAIILFVMMCWTSGFNAVRQGLAVAIVFSGISAIRDHDFVKYFLIVIIGFLFHRSAVVILILYFLANRKVTIGNIILMILICVAVLLSSDKLFQVVNVVLDHNLTGEEAYWSTQVNRLRPLIRMAPSLFFIYEYRDEVKTREINFYLNILIFEAVVGIITMNSAGIARISLYTFPFSVIAIAELLKGLKIEKRGLISSVIVLLYWGVAWFECKGTTFTFAQLRWFW